MAMNFEVFHFSWREQIFPAYNSSEDSSLAFPSPSSGMCVSVLIRKFKRDPTKISMALFAFCTVYSV